MDEDAYEPIVTAALESDGYFTATVPTNDEALAIRAAGRRAGRKLGWRIQTLHNLGPESGSFVAHVIVTKADPLHERLHSARTMTAMRKAMDALDPWASDGEAQPPS